MRRRCSARRRSNAAGASDAGRGRGVPLVVNGLRVPPASIPHAVFEAGRRFADRIAIVDDTERMSFAELARETRAAAKACMAAGLRKGDVVGVWAPNMWQWIAAAAGAQAAGAVLVPLNTRMRGPEIAEAASRAGIKLLFSIGKFLGLDYPSMLHAHDMPTLERVVVIGADARQTNGRCQGWHTFLDAGAGITDAALDTRLAELQGSDLADIMFTSGTTGQPKGAIFSHERSLLGAATWRGVTALAPGDRYLAFGPFSHTASYKAGWVTTMLAGCTLYAVNKLDPVSLMTLVSRERIAFMPAPPTILQSIVTHPSLRDFDLSSVRFISTGAAVVPIELVRRLKIDLAVDRIATGYGMTECCGSATATQPDDPLEIVANSAGRAVPGIELRCLRQNGTDAAPGEAGEVLMRGRKLMLRYLDNPAATAETIDADGWLHSGDIGVLDAAGNLSITDRLKDMYIVGGFNCYPAEIERNLAGLHGVTHCAVIGVPDERLGEVGRAYIVRSPHSTLTEADVFAWCRQNLANYKTPRSVTFLDALPLNASGKVMKQALRQLG